MSRIETQEKNPYLVSCMANKQLDYKRRVSVTRHIVDLLRERMPADQFRALHRKAIAATALARSGNMTRRQYRAMRDRMINREIDRLFRQGVDATTYKKVEDIARKRMNAYKRLPS